MLCKDYAEYNVCSVVLFLGVTRWALSLTRDDRRGRVGKTTLRHAAMREKSVATLNTIYIILILTQLVKIHNGLARLWEKWQFVYKLSKSCVSFVLFLSEICYHKNNKNICQFTSFRQNLDKQQVWILCFKGNMK